MTPAEIAARALALLGPDGEHWTRWALVKHDERLQYGPNLADGTLDLIHGDSWCLVGGLAVAAGVALYNHDTADRLTTFEAWQAVPEDARDAVMRVIRANYPRYATNPSGFNDSASVTWDDIRAVLEKVAAG